MKKGKISNFAKKWILLIIALAILSFSLFYVARISISYGKLEHIHEELNQKYLILEENYNILSEDYNALEVEYNSLKEENTQLREEQIQTGQEVEATLAKIEEFDQKIEEDMAWFRDNNNIKGKYRGPTKELTLRDDCVEYSQDECLIKLACLPLFSLHIWDIEYGEDIKLYGKEDRLQSLTELIENKVGDCEDYSLLITAEINYLKEVCLDKGYSLNEIFFEGIVEGNRNYFITPSWYYEDAEAYVLPKDYVHAYPVCGTWLEDGTEFGHCVTAITNTKVRSSSDIDYALGNSILVESSNGWLAPVAEWLYIIILEDDIKYLGPNEYGDYVWSGYSELKSELNNLRISFES
jgi:hypothetical protein